jgi:hypothetical protein
VSSVVDFTLQGTIGTTRKPKRYDIDMYQGDTFSFYLTLSGAGLDVTGWTGSAKVQKISDSSPVSSVITVSAVDTTNKRFTISVDSDLLTPGTEYKYDVQVTDSGGGKRTFIGGKITVTEDITEP